MLKVLHLVTIWQKKCNLYKVCLEKLKWQWLSYHSSFRKNSFQICIIFAIHWTFNLWFSLTERRTFHTAVQVYKIVNKISPPYLHDTFSFAVQVILVGMYTHYLFPELKPTMVNSHWLTGAQSFGTGCQVHFMVPKLGRSLKSYTVEYCNCIICVYACPVSLALHIVCLLVILSGHSWKTAFWLMLFSLNK